MGKGVRVGAQSEIGDRYHGIWACCLLGILLVLPATATADSDQPLYATYWVGRYTDQHLYEDILGQHNLVFQRSWAAAVAVARPVSESATHRWELEGQVLKHFGKQTHWEITGEIVLRWTDFPWNPYLKTTFGIGDGLSYASTIPPLEAASHTNEGAARLLNYVVLETTFAPPQVEHWALVMRVHHRSGTFGLFSGVHGGSTIIGVGIRWKYD